VSTPGAETEAPKAPAPTPDRRGTWTRLAVLVLVLVLSAVVAHYAGVTEYLSRDRIRALISGLGPMGAFAFIGLFVLGELAHVPGFVFIGAAILAYGRLEGGVLGYVGALAAVAVAFLVVRGIGGQALSSIRRPIVVRLLAHVDDRPVLAVAGLRSVLWMTPALTYALALTRVRFRDYMIGSALGLAVPIALMSWFFDWLLTAG
jgi:uncharacterized membrane protein YdjX (TVP38/TMEM64 family)